MCTYEDYLPRSRAAWIDGSSSALLWPGPPKRDSTLRCRDGSEEWELTDVVVRLVLVGDGERC